MLKIGYDEIKKRIRDEKGLTDEEIEQKVKQKLDQLSGLVSNEGAAHIIANELGVKVFPDVQKKRYKVKEIMAGLRGIELVGKIIKKYETRTFSKDGREGRVASLLVGDETGVIRLVFWDENHIDKVESMNENDVVKISNAYSKENQGFKEIHVGNRSELTVNPEGESVDSVQQKQEYSQKKIESLQEGDFVKIMGTIVQIFEPRFYEACPECSKKLVLEGESKVCKEHGSVAGSFIPILNFIFDDGTDNIRVVCFRDVVEKVLGKTPEDVQKYRENVAEFEGIRSSIQGKQLMITGRVSKNEMFDRLEFVAQDVSDANPKVLMAETSQI